MTTETHKTDGVHRLVDMVVEEVSLVDRAANKHRFLIVKRDEAMDDDKTQNTTPAEPSPRLSGLKWEFGGEGEYGAARRAAGSARSGDFGTVLGARGSASVTKRPVRGPSSRGLLDPVLGTTAERLIERLPCAALVVRQRARTPYRTLLACVDTSPAAIEALRRGMALAPDARVHVVHAHELPLSATLRRLRLHTQATAHLSAERTRVRAAVEAALTDAGIDMRRVKLTLRSGLPSRVIERAAARLAPDLIAVGHSASLLGRLFLGSTARHVLRMDIGDILVARAG